MSRPAISGLLASAGLVAASLAWVWLARPPDAAVLTVSFVLLAVFGAWLPGLANHVTLARAYLSAPGYVYALSAPGLLPLALVVILAGLTDVLDGAVARRSGQATRLGAGLDPVVDGVFFGAVAVGLAVGQAYPVWLCAAVILRYALPAVAAAALLVVGRRPELQHTPLGKLSTTLIGLLLGGVALLRGVGIDTTLLLEVSKVAIPLSAVATFTNLFWINRARFFDQSATR